MRVDLVNWMGSDLTVANSARVSFNKHKEELDDKDIRLLNYLAKHGHFTPFTHPQITFRVTAPIFVARQLDKHQVGLTKNEISRRYVDDEPEFWYPGKWRGRPENAKQGSSAAFVCLDANTAYETAIKTAVDAYNNMLRVGVAPEMARSVLPQSMLTSWYWTGSLSAFSRICQLRLDSHAQQETGEIAQMINDHCKELFPYSWEALQT